MQQYVILGAGMEVELEGLNWEDFIPVKRSVIALLGIIIVCLLTVLEFEKDIIFQEGNPVPIAIGIAKLSFSEDAPT